MMWGGLPDEEKGESRKAHCAHCRRKEKPL